jgi:hypothetical protein
MDKIPLRQMWVDNCSGPLRKFLIMCAACERIRGDNGYWRYAERYPASHEDMEISHGICPECARALYPEYYR